MAEVAAGIALALRRGDQPGAQQLIEAAGQIFDRGLLVTEVGLAAHRLERDALRAAHDGRPEQPYKPVDAYDEGRWLE